MTKISDQDRKALETYVLGDKEKALASLIKGTHMHSYLTLIDEFKQKNGHEKLNKANMKLLSKLEGKEKLKLKTHTLLL